MVINLSNSNTNGLSYFVCFALFACLMSHFVPQKIRSHDPLDLKRGIHGIIVMVVMYLLCFLISQSVKVSRMSLLSQADQQ